MARQSPRKSLSKQVIVEKVKVEPAPSPKKGNSVLAKTKVAVTKAKVQIQKTAAGRKRKAAEAEDHECDSHGEEDEDVKPKAPAPKKQRKSKAAKEEDMAPLASRTAVTSLKRAMYIGAHVSGAGGVQNAVSNAVQIGANAFALFLKSQRKWESPPLADEARDAFHQKIKEQNYAAGLHVLPHGSYLVNLAQKDADKAAQAFNNFVDDLKRCEALGIRLYNFHPGSTGGEPRPQAIGRISAQLNKSHKETKTVITLVENMCGSGNVIGSRFEELRDIIAGVEDKSRVGVCIDTCHAFAAGYDLRSPEAFAATMAEFDKVVGIKYLKAFHLNDSKAPLASHRDLHANIGTGFLGLRAFHNIMNYEPLQNLPMVLETPIDRKGPDGKVIEDRQIWADEIKLLESLIGADAESADFKAKEKSLQEKGAAERTKLQDQVDRKAEKDAKKAAPKKRKGKKKAESDEEDSD
ncbi:putative dna-(apurinic or apyrimidinic site) lyase 1 protein [Phaeoacremonium minimum UCRPA7]|uniref:Apurinic-apyrimidinic endonuclease 1 n=1 Tax=Phaeoacremonium minimum (strain UCR-PA7) TaxID=1286976 RepID=R8BF46_PHAM7|nr:putative dna-(apurinic or apyrimidinic site) lyase 1 protein [Phaeoacremonium minimum UCRPA7]EON97918.1 putative dna-(apurinic or apyrimidinic site) lyase 1 protein [Phaeoacremonium minimum UCRPA7]